MLLSSFDALYKWNVRRWPVVLVKASDLHTKTYQDRGETHTNVLGTIDFDRPDGSTTVHCQIKDFVLGSDHQKEAYAATFELAVYPGSCGGVVRLPLEGFSNALPNTLRDWLTIYFMGLIGSAVFAAGRASVTMKP